MAEVAGVPAAAAAGVELGNGILEAVEAVFLSPPNTNVVFPSPLPAGVAVAPGVPAAVAPPSTMPGFESVGAAPCAAGVVAAPPKVNVVAGVVAGFPDVANGVAAGFGSGSFSILRLNSFKIASSLARLFAMFLVGGK